MEPQIIFEDNDILIVDKPSGWITNKANTTVGQPVLQDWLSKKFDYLIAKNEKLRSGVVHRLDKETSGLLIIAKTGNSFVFLQGEFKKRKVKKEYLALTHGTVEPEKGSIEVPVGRLPWTRKKFGVVPGGRGSKTFYDVISFYKKKDERYSFLKLRPVTGRTHQIRIHLKYLGHSIVADELYAGRKTSRRDRDWCTRLFLHAGKITFTHPENKKMISFESELPKQLETALASLEKIMDKN